MVTRRVAVILEGNSSPLVRAFDAAADSADRLGDRVSAVGRHVRDNEEHYTRAGTAIAAFGAATTAAIGASAAAAVSWQSDFAGVRKTVDDTSEGYAQLSDELREMARTLPSSHQEIAATAEAAGQLGIAREDITSFTRTMIDLGETTDLTADQAATGIAQITNVMGTAAEDTERFASTLVELGNNGASTESEILSLAQRLAGAGALIGATEADVLALASAMSSVGIEAQLGGGSMSRAMIQMNSAVLEGGKGLQAFADVAGVSAAEFARRWNEDPVLAVQAFVEGLGRIQDTGGDAAGALADVGLKGTENAQVFLRLTGASDLLVESLDLSKVAWEENTALANEAQQRYDTVASQLQVLKNNAVDAGISLGETFLPALAGASEIGSQFLASIGALPEPLRDLVAWGGAAAGVTSLMGGAMLVAAPQALATYRALRELSIIGPRAATGIKAVTGVLMGPWGIAIAGAVTAIGFFAAGQAAARAEAEELRTTLDEQTGAITDNTRAWWVNSLEERGILEQYEQMGGSVRDLTLAIEGDEAARRRIVRTVEDYARANEKAASSTGGLGVSLADTSTKSAVFMQQLDALGLLTEEQAEKQRRLAEANEGAGRSTEVLATETRRLQAQADAYLATQEQIPPTLAAFVSASEMAAAAGEDVLEQFNKQRDALGKIPTSFVDVNAALKANEEAARAWAEQTAEEAGKGKEAWQDYVADAAFSLNTFLEELERQVAAQEAWETNILLLTGRMSAAAVQMLYDMGPAGAQAAQALVDGTEQELARFEAVAEAQGASHGQTYATNYIDAISAPVVAAAISKFGWDAGEGVVREMAERIRSGELTVAQAVEEYDLNAYVHVHANNENYERDLEAGLQLARDADATVPIRGDSRPAEERLSTLEQIIEASTPSLKIDAQDDLAQGVRLGLMADVEDNPATLDLLGNATEAERVHALLLAAINTVPGVVPINADATAAFGTLQWFLSQIPRSVTIGLSAMGGPLGLAGAAMGVLRRAGGGAIYGEGGPTDDRVLVAASNGEHMLTAAEVNAAGGHAEIYRLRKALLSGQVRYDVGGGIEHPRAVRERMGPPPLTSAPPMYHYQPPAPAAGAQVEVNVPVHTTERVDPVALGAEIAWQVGGLPS